MIAVLGAPAAGKSSLSGWIGQQLSWDVLSLDATFASQAELLGYQQGRADRSFARGGARALHQYMLPFEIGLLELATMRATSQVLDCSGGICLTGDSELDVRLLSALYQCEQVLVARPAGPVEAVVRELSSRVRARRSEDPMTLSWLARGGRAVIEQVVRGCDLIDLHHADVVVCGGALDRGPEGE